MIGQTDLPEPVKLYIDKANSSLNKLQHLINDLLDVSKIKAGRLKFDRTIFDLGELVKQCSESCRHIYPTHKITEELEKNIMINGNEERLEQVLQFIKRQIGFFNVELYRFSQFSLTDQLNISFETG